MRIGVVLVAFLAGCDDTIFPGGGGSDTDVVTSDWCGVRTMIGSDCASCHSATSANGGLDLETDPHAALVGATSTTDPSLTLVVAGDPDSSFLMRKLTADLSGTEGVLMPPTGAEPEATIAAVREWIAAGASAECSDTDIIIPGDYHPAGWADPSSHGMALKTHDTANGRDGRDANCRLCHGGSLDGGTSGVSCDGCHAGANVDSWRTNCTFCHGGVETDGGAPPEDIDDQSDVETLSFRAHTSHVTQPSSATHFAYDCTTCHDKPSDVENILAAGHIFDDTTDAVAEVDFTGGLSDRGTWNGAGTCSNLYCHGNGQGDNGTYSHTAATPTCGGCHAWENSGESAIDRMSGEHHAHVWDENVSCDTCHAATINGSTIIDTSQHLDGAPDVQIGSDGGTIVYNNGRCTGSCHNEQHNARSW